MIYYQPIILESTESTWSIWLEINQAVPIGEQLNLHVIARTGTMNPLKEKEGFYLGPEEGFEQVVFRCPVDKTSFIEMVDEVMEKLNEQQRSKKTMSFSFDSNLEEDFNFGVLIDIGGLKEICRFQLVHKKGAIHSKIQIRTSHEKLKTFFTEFKKKIEYRTRD